MAILTRDPPSPTNRWPIGMIGALGLILALEGLVARMPFHPEGRTRLLASWGSAWREAAEGTGAGAEILCFGDSQIKLGIQPRILEARLGRSVYNLAVIGGQPPTTYYLLRRVLDAGHSPRALVVDFSPLLLGTDPRENLEWWAGLPDLRERIALILRAGEPGLAMALAAHGAVASLSGRDAVREALGLVVPGDRRLRDDELRILQRNWSRNLGAQAAPGAFVRIQGSLPRPYDGPGWGWAPHPVQDDFVERFLGAAQERAVPVYWIIPPAESVWLERNRRCGTIDAYRRYVRELVGDYPTLRVLDLQDAGWDRRWFRDPIHLNREGAARLSLAVADAMAQTPDGEPAARRWITMDGGSTTTPRHYREMLEDLDQSRLAVGRGASGPITMEDPSR